MQYHAGSAMERVHLDILGITLGINSRLRWPRRRAHGLDSNIPLVQPPRPQILLLVFKQQLAQHLGP